MEYSESLQDYYRFTNKQMPKDLLCNDGTTAHFNVLKRGNCSNSLPFVRRNYWKITLLDSRAQLETQYQTTIIDQPCVVFSIPEISYGWKPLSEEQTGFICLFNSKYLTSELKAAFRLLTGLFKACHSPFIFLRKEEYDVFMFYFQKMHDEYGDNFEYKKAVIQSLLQLVVYLAIKIKRRETPISQSNSSGNHLVNKFMEILDYQFPVDSPRNSIQYKTPADFAFQLNVHVNHLNHILKTHTGKSTTQLIGERIVTEAIDLLGNSDWNISEIAESLGFEYLQHFTYFFKKHVGETPRNFKSILVKNI